MNIGIWTKCVFQTYLHLVFKHSVTIQICAQEEDYLQLKAGEEAHIVDEARMESEDKERAKLMDEKEMRITGEMSPKDVVDEQARLKAEEEARITG